MHRVAADIARLICQFLDLRSRAKLGTASGYWHIISRSPSSWPPRLECAAGEQCMWAFEHGCLRPRELVLTSRVAHQTMSPFPFQWQPHLQLFSWSNGISGKRISSRFVTNCGQLEVLHLAGSSDAPFALPASLRVIRGTCHLHPAMGTLCDLSSLRELEFELPEPSIAAGRIGERVYRYNVLKSVYAAGNLQLLSIRYFQDLPDPWPTPIWTQKSLRVLRFPDSFNSRAPEISIITSLIRHAQETLQELQLPQLLEPPHTPVLYTWDDDKFLGLLKALGKLAAIKFLWVPGAELGDLDQRWDVLAMYVTKPVILLSDVQEKDEQGIVDAFMDRKVRYFDSEHAMAAELACVGASATRKQVWLLRDD